MLWCVWSSPRREYMLGVSQILMNYRLQDLSHDSLLINCINTKQFLFAFLQKLSGLSLFGALSDHASHPADVTSNVTIGLNRVISATAYFGTMEQRYIYIFLKQTSPILNSSSLFRQSCFWVTQSKGASMQGKSNYKLLIPWSRKCSGTAG